MKSIFRFIVLCGIIFGSTMIQGCSGVSSQSVDFTSLKVDASALEDPIPRDDDPIPRDDDPVEVPEEVVEEVVEIPEEPQETSDLEEVLNQNKACRDLFSPIDPGSFPAHESLHISGILDQVVVANVGKLHISGIANLIAGKNIGTATVSGIHGSICLQAERVTALSGIVLGGAEAHLALVGPNSGELGYAQALSGIANSDIVLANYEVKTISGIGRKLHVFGGRVHKVSGIFDEIHLYENAVIDNLNGINKGVIQH